MDMEHIIVTELANGLLRLRAEEGYGLYNDIAQRFFSEAVVKSTDGFRAIPNGISPEPHERTLQDAIKERLALLHAYDQSENVLSFTFNGQKMWLNPQQRTNYLMTINAAEEQGMIAVPFGGQQVPIAQARAVLNALAIYAMQAMAVTDAHDATIRAKRKIETVDTYDYTVGYPDNLTF